VTEEARFTHESFQDACSIAAYFQSLIEGFEQGSIVLTSDEGELNLHPKDMLTFAVRAKKKGEKTKLTIKISWKDTGSADKAFSITA
jgi:amphi-Trp domain-containing protein